MHLIDLLMERLYTTDRMSYKFSVIKIIHVIRKTREKKQPEPDDSRDAEIRGSRNWRVLGILRCFSGL